MEEQSERTAADTSMGIAVSQIVWRAEAMGIDPDRVTRALGVPPPPLTIADPGEEPGPVA